MSHFEDIVNDLNEMKNNDVISEVGRFSAQGANVSDGVPKQTEEILRENFSTLLLTARIETQRKDTEISKLRALLDYERRSAAVVQEAFRSYLIQLQSCSEASMRELSEVPSVRSNRHLCQQLADLCGLMRLPNPFVTTDISLPTPLFPPKASSYTPIPGVIPGLSNPVAPKEQGSESENIMFSSYKETLQESMNQLRHIISPSNESSTNRSPPDSSSKKSSNNHERENRQGNEYRGGPNGGRFDRGKSLSNSYDRNQRYDKGRSAHQRSRSRSRERGFKDRDRY